MEGEKFVEQHGWLSNSWSDLLDHAEDLMERKEDLFLAQYRLLGAVMRKKDMPDMKTFVSIYGKIICNSFSLRSDTRKISVSSCDGSKYIHSNIRPFVPEPFGIGIYLLGSILGHSCVPSCNVKFLGRNLFITAREEIPASKLSTMATISYVNTMSDTKTRSKELMENWFLTCNCALCLNIKLDAAKHCMACPACAADRAVDTLQWSMPGPCSECGAGRGKEDKQQMDRYKQLYQLANMNGGPQMSDISFDYLSAWCAGEMSSVFGTTDILYMSTVHHVHSLCLTNSLWSAAAVYGQIALPAVRRYAGERSSVVAALLVSLGEATGREGKLEKSRKLFFEADGIFKEVLGIEYPFYQQQVYKKYVDISKESNEFVKY